MQKSHGIIAFLFKLPLQDHTRATCIAGLIMQERHMLLALFCYLVNLSLNYFQNI